VVAILCGLALFIIYWREKQQFYLIYNLAMISSYTLTATLNLIGKFSAARILTVFISIFWICASVLVFDIRVGIEYFLYDLAVTPFVIFLRREWNLAAISSFISFLMLVVLQFVDFSDILMFQISEDGIKNIHAVFAITAFIGIAIPFLLVFRMRYTVGKIYLQEYHLTAQNDHLRSLGEISAGIAHEISNPLAIISGRISMIQNLVLRKEVNSDIMNKCRDSMLKQISRIESITNSLRNLSTSKESKSHVDLEAIFEDSVQELKEQLDAAGISISFQRQLSGVYILGNSELLKRVFTNLLSNSIYAISNVEDRWILSEFSVLDQMLVVSITDSGLRIPDEISQEIFRPFFSTKPPGKGTGLGLSIVKKILNDHNAHFFLDKRNRNTRFVIYFPIT
jgi:signal transduction histidine kinase